METHTKLMDARITTENRCSMRKIVPNQSVKRPGSPIAGASGSGAKKRSRKPVDILEDVWLEALKHLTCPKWSKMRLVSHQLNGVVDRNVSRLPLAIVDSAAMKMRGFYFIGHQTEAEIEIIVSDSTVSSDKQEQWFKDRGSTIGVPGDIQLNNAIIGVDLKENCYVDLCILGPAQREELTADERARLGFFGQQFKAEVRFYAGFSPLRNKYSWASMAFFLKLLYDPSTYVKKLSMHGLSKNLKEILLADEEHRYIRCKEFILEVTPGTYNENLCESVSWLEQNVQADIVQFPDGIRIYDAMSNYLLGSSWTSASQVVKVGRVNDLERFFRILIEKFPTVVVQSIFPTVVFGGYQRRYGGRCAKQSFCCDSLNKRLSGKSIVREKLEDPEDDSSGSQYNETYTISNGSNRMRIGFIRLYYY